jgi:predicted dithiol-disulfide oxidoreductase (DUF899 family)
MKNDWYCLQFEHGIRTECLICSEPWNGVRGIKQRLEGKDINLAASNAAREKKTKVNKP